MTAKKIIKISLISLSSLVLLIFVLFSLFSFSIVKGKLHRGGRLSLNADQAEKQHTIIAKYYMVKDSNNQPLTGFLKDELFLERMYVEEKYYYIYYSPTFFSDQYYVNDDVFIGSRITHDSIWEQQFTDYHKNNIMVKTDGDTLYENNGASRPIKSIPKTLTIYINGKLTANYNLASLYQENLKSIPKTSFLGRFSRGPLFDDDYN